MKSKRPPSQLDPLHKVKMKENKEIKMETQKETGQKENCQLKNESNTICIINSWIVCYNNGTVGLNEWKKIE